MISRIARGRRLLSPSTIIKIISRGKRKSAVAAAAYRSGEKITNNYDGLTHDYTRKGGVAHAEILLPDHAPREYFGRATLWNAVEKIEKNCNAQLAREIELALPKELNSQQQMELVRDYCRKFFVSAGMCADICIHDKGDGNPHAHILLTMRPIEPDGSWAAKSKKEYILDENGDRIILPSGSYKTQKIDTVDWNEQTKAEEWRTGWAEMYNRCLEQNNVVERIDHRSYKRQGVEQIPTVHMGVAVFQMEKRGICTERGDMNRQIEITNAELRQMKARINRLKKWLDDGKNAVPSTLSDVLSMMLNSGENQSRYQIIVDLKIAAKTLMFMQNHNITNITELRYVVGGCHTRKVDMGGRLNQIDRRLKALSEHIKQTEVYKKYKDMTLPLDSPEKILFDAAKRYLADVLNGHRLNLKAWKDEHETLLVKKSGLNAEYRLLKDEVREIEVLRKYAEKVQSTVALTHKMRAHGMEI